MCKVCNEATFLDYLSSLLIRIINLCLSAIAALVQDEGRCSRGQLV
jgi:hypothetical protein